ncbi:MAG: PDZ domain-containing protein, partial [Alphaproteobacteria bacterium]|nr:PDZ domain-containing protein [Alphaproteobacteria bacterium]
SRITRLVGEADINKPTPLKVWRKGKILDLQVKLGEYEDAEEKGLLNDATGETKNVKKNQSVDVLGITVAPRPDCPKDGSIKGGISVLKVVPMSTASELGLQQGDIILEANQKEVNKPKDLQSIVDDAKKNKRKHILLLVMRQGEPRYAPLKIEPEEQETKKKNTETNVEEG